jgi:hypothetical protein
VTIEWCKNSLKFAGFSVNKPFPPLDFRPEGFDFIYALSVFIHIDEEMENAWIQELHRVLCVSWDNSIRKGILQIGSGGTSILNAISEETQPEIHDLSAG